MPLYPFIFDHCALLCAPLSQCKAPKQQQRSPRQRQRRSSSARLQKNRDSRDGALVSSRRNSFSLSDTDITIYRYRFRYRCVCVWLCSCCYCYYCDLHSLFLSPGRSPQFSTLFFRVFFSVDPRRRSSRRRRRSGCNKNKKLRLVFYHFYLKSFLLLNLSAPDCRCVGLCVRECECDE